MVCNGSPVSHTCTVRPHVHCTLHMWWPLSSPHTRCSPPPGPGHSGGLCREGGEPCWDMVRRSEHRQSHSVCTLTWATCPHLVCTITHAYLAHTHMCGELDMRYPWDFVNILMLADIFRVSDPSSLHWAGCNERGQPARGYRPQHYHKIAEFHRNAWVAAPVTTRVQARPGSASARV